MSVLNKQVCTVEKDRLIYDSRHPIDATAVQVSVTSGAAGEISRGQLLDCVDGIYSVHAEGGTASAIAAESVSYEAGDTDITVAVYISGSFRASQIIADPEITDTDRENLRDKGIYLK